MRVGCFGSIAKLLIAALRVKRYTRGMTVLSVALGGAIGASLRYGVGAWALRVFGPGFPVGTMVVNVLGSLIMGVVAVAMLHRFSGSWGNYAPFVMTGVLGGFTTFSAFSLDALNLMESGRIGHAALYVGGSVLLSIFALFCGLTLGRAVWP